MTFEQVGRDSLDDGIAKSAEFKERQERGGTVGLISTAVLAEKSTRHGTPTLPLVS
jgi:hypothetical protein